MSDKLEEKVYSKQDITLLLKLYPPSFRECVTCEHYEKSVNDFPCRCCKWSGDLFPTPVSYYTPDMKKVMKFVYVVDNKKKSGGLFDDD